MPLQNFDENIAVVDGWCKVVVIHDFLRDVLDGDLHVLITRHWHSQIEVLDVNGHELGMLGEEDTVGVHLDGGEIGSWSVGFSGIVNLIATDGETDVTFFGLLVGLESSNNA